MERADGELETSATRCTFSDVSPPMCSFGGGIVGSLLSAIMLAQ